MPRKSEIDIFNVMEPEELEESLKSNKNSVRYYKRILL